MTDAMQRRLNGHVCDVPASGIREIFDLAAGRDDVLHLEVGEPDFATPPHIVEAAIASARDRTGYTTTAGIPALREAIASRLHRIHGLDVSPADVIVTHGGTQGVALVVEAFVEPGAEVLVPDPGWPNCEMCILSHGGKLVHYRLDPGAGFLPDPGEIASLVTDRTKLLVLNTPSNPAGSVMPQSLIDDIADVARRHGVVVLSDEVYDEIIFDGRTPVTAAKHTDVAVGVYSFSKSYAMTGWRVGYVAATADLITRLTRIQEGTIACVSSVTQAAALAALDGPQDIVATMRDTYESRRDLVVEKLAEARIEAVVPSGAFYLMLPLAPGADARACALDLVGHGVAVAPGTAFGTAACSHLRLSLASSGDVLEAAMKRVLTWYNATGGGVQLA